jgi:hypothetical protein
MARNANRKSRIPLKNWDSKYFVTLIIRYINELREGRGTTREIKLPLI